MKKNYEAGQGLLEYAFILILIAIALIVALSVFGPAIGGVYSNITEALGV
jgi:Flp pilus assembly pilin Flp